MPAKREPSRDDHALSLESAVAAQRDDLVKLAGSQLLPPAWRKGHQAGFLRGAAWAAKILGASVIHAPPARVRDTVDEV